MKIGLALSGGGVRGAAHVGAIKALEENEIKYQVCELGKVDIGGGGTIAYILANKGVDVIDCGVPVLSMHAPYEVTSKYDIYSAFKAYKFFSGVSISGNGQLSSDQHRRIGI